uniref:Uncharacterized protein n=1 Tax=Rhizophora mucronata TaxID=61149 RepID=A0A2P2IUP8_RHIMU
MVTCQEYEIHSFPGVHMTISLHVGVCVLNIKDISFIPSPTLSRSYN